MNISGTLHFYSGDDKELFFVFDDDVAQQLYSKPQFEIDNLESRRAYISIGDDRFIHRRTLSFSRKQSEIKISLCSRSTKDGLGALTKLYDWFSRRGRPRPVPFRVLGTLRKMPHSGERVWELQITEPVDLIDPPGLPRRRKLKSRERKSFEHRRRIQARDLADIGRRAERLAFELAEGDFPVDTYSCYWRKEFLDSERIEIRRLGIIADIDVWNAVKGAPQVFIEVKAQKVAGVDADPIFFVSAAELNSYRRALKAKVPYQVWLFQYRDVRDFGASPQDIDLTVFNELGAASLTPNGYTVTPGPGSGRKYEIFA